MSLTCTKQVAHGRASFTIKTSKWQLLWVLENKNQMKKLLHSSNMMFLLLLFKIFHNFMIPYLLLKLIINTCLNICSLISQNHNLPVNTQFVCNIQLIQL